jgi:hypothetical protein
LIEDLKEFPDFSMTVTVLRPSEKSWAMTANATIIPTWNSSWNPIPIANPSMKL